jgi:ribosomal protein L4
MARRWYRIRSNTTQLFYKLPKKVRRLAIKSALSSKVNDNNIIVLEDLTLDAA